MNKKLGAGTLPRRILIVFLVTIGLECSSFNPQIAGNGSEVETAIVQGTVADSNGMPASNVQVQIIRGNYNPATDGPIPDSFIDTTGPDGRYAFQRLKPATYNIEAINLTDKTRLLIRTVRIRSTTDSLEAPEGYLRAPGVLIVRLPQASDTTGAFLYIEGTTIYETTYRNIDSNLCMVLDAAPAGELPPIYFGKHTGSAVPVLLNNRVEIKPGDTAIVAGLSNQIGYPDAATTGPEAGGYTNLQEVTTVDDIQIGDTPPFATRLSNGWLLIEGKSFHQTFQIYQDSVILRGCRVIASDSLMPALYLRGNTGYLIEYCEIHAPGPSQKLRHCISSGAGNITIRYNNFCWWEIAVLLSGNDISATDNYMHDPTSEGTNAIAHLGGGNRLVFNHNTLENSNPSTSCIALFQDGTAGTTGFNDVQVDDNWVAGGGYTFYCGFEKAMDPLYNMRFTNNKFSVKFYPACGYFGAATSQPAWNADGNSWSGNIWADGPDAGRTVP